MGLLVKKLEVNGVEYELSGSGSGSNVNIIDNLETADAESALSANQGKILNDKINNFNAVDEFNIILTANDWVGDSAPYTQSVVINEISDINNCSIQISSSATTNQTNAAALADIDDISYDESNNALVFTANGIKPEVDLPIILTTSPSMNVVEVPKYLNDTSVREIEGELTVDGWVGDTAPYTQTVIIEEELSDYNNCNIALSSSATDEQIDAIAIANIIDVSYNENTNAVTFTIDGTKPTINIPFTVSAAYSMNVVESPNYIGLDIPTNHASSETTYGAGSSVNYGHVKVSDNYISSDGDASEGVAASSKALIDACDNLTTILNVYPDYSQTTTLLTENDIGEDEIRTITISETGYYYAYCSSEATTTRPFIRLSIPNKVVLYAGYGDAVAYQYLTSNMLLLRKGDIITVQLSGAVKRFYKVPIRTDL